MADKHQDNQPTVLADKALDEVAGGNAAELLQQAASELKKLSDLIGPVQSDAHDAQKKILQNFRT